MDLSSILPIILKNSGMNMDKFSPLFNGFDKNKKADPMQQILTSALHNNNKQPQGLTPIIKLANDDIIGKLCVYFSSVRR